MFILPVREYHASHTATGVAQFGRCAILSSRKSLAQAASHATRNRAVRKSGTTATVLAVETGPLQTASALG